MTDKQPFFPYRAWSIAAWKDWDLQDMTLDRALAEAPRHQISCIELQDYVTWPYPAWVDAPARFRSFPKLDEADQLTYHGRTLTKADRKASADRMKTVAQKVRDAGYELQVWYHCLGNHPAEAFEMYPEMKDADGEALYRFLGESLEDCFEFFPEITGLTITSLHETTSLLQFAGDTSQAERMHRLYKTFADTCRKYDRRLILRDFIARKSELNDFSEVVDRLPADVVVQTKICLADWSAHEKPVNPYIFEYAKKKNPLVVEFELANNYTGETDLPWSDPEQIWRQIRLLAETGIHGAVGRILNSGGIQSGTIFNCPNEANVWAFSRTLFDPGRILQEPSDAWWHDYDHMDMSIWTDWAKLRFGEKAAGEVVHVLQQTPRMVALTLNICGAYFMVLSHHHERHRRGLDNWLPAAIEAVERCGIAHARAEKDEAMRIVTDGLARIEKLKDAMPAEGYANIHGALTRAKHLVAMFRATAEAFVRALEVHAGRMERSSLLEATAELRAVIQAAHDVYGDKLFEGASADVNAMAEYMEEFPDRVDEVRKNTGLYGK